MPDHETGLEIPTALERVPAPTWDELEEMADDGLALATDGCTVEPDGECRHGAQSWLLELGCI
jgi:hypothetical protein